MDVTIEFNESAFRHGFSREDIKHALEHKIHAATIDGYSEKYGVIGLSCNGVPLEIVYNLVDDDTICVFHAMKARNSFAAMLLSYGIVL